MVDIVALLHCLNTCLTKTVLRQLSHVVFAMLAMAGRVTMLGLSRWAGKGGSYRTVQRFFYTMVNFAYRLLRDSRQAEPDCSVLDLKARFRGYKYVDEMLKLLPQKPEPILLPTSSAKSPV